jgi:hypothetical protein
MVFSHHFGDKIIKLQNFFNANGLASFGGPFFEKYLEFINSECVTAIYKQGCNTLFIVG